MNTLLTVPEPGTNPATSSFASMQPLNPVEPRARILYVDDEPQLRRLVQLVLVRSGYEVDTAADGAEAWAALHDQEYHLLITDNDMPRLTGMELIMQARQAGMRLPVVMTSGSLIANDDLAAAGPDHTAFLPKPFAPDTLVKFVEQVLFAANHERQSSKSTISVLAHITCSTESYLRGGINE